MAAKPRKRRSKKELDDAALRRGYLEAYAARQANKRLSRLRTELGISMPTLDRWMQDPEFTKLIDDIDDRRLRAAQQLATTLWPEIIERQASIALAELPEPPDEPDKDLPDYAFRKRLLADGYRAACAQAVKMSVRSAELVGKYLHQLQPQAAGVNVFAAGSQGVEPFGRLSEHKTTEELLAEVERRQGILERYKRRHPGEAQA